MITDTHCHLNFHLFDSDLPDVIQRAKKEKITKIIVPGAKIDSSAKAAAISSEFSQIYNAIGIHPHHVMEEFNKNGKSLEKILALLQRQVTDKTVAIGEIGLDKHFYKNYPPVSGENFILQEKFLIGQLKIAQKLNLPVIFHCREAYKDLFKILRKTPAIKGVLHCFEGSKDNLLEALDLDLYIGFDGPITYKNKGSLKEIASITPQDKILVETDSPFLTPEPIRGIRNEPAFIIHILKILTQTLNIPFNSTAALTNDNAARLFFNKS